MYYVYLLQSELFADQRYVGITSDLTAIVGSQSGEIGAHVEVFPVAARGIRCVLG